MSGAPAPGRSRDAPNAEAVDTEFPPEHYFQTATQRMRQAQHLYQEGTSFALAIYVGGVPVECLLRAFKGRRDPTFDEKHDLLRLFAAIGTLRVDRDKLRAKQWTDEQIDWHLRTLQVAVNQIFRLWANKATDMQRMPPTTEPLSRDFPRRGVLRWVIADEKERPALWTHTSPRTCYGRSSTVPLRARGIWRAQASRAAPK